MRTIQLNSDTGAPKDTLSGPIRELIRGAYKLDGALLLVLDVDKALEIEGAVAAA